MSLRVVGALFVLLGALYVIALFFPRESIDVVRAIVGLFLIGGGAELLALKESGRKTILVILFLYIALDGIVSAAAVINGHYEGKATILGTKYLINGPIEYFLVNLVLIIPALLLAILLIRAKAAGVLSR